jgi:hypothetical protein
MAATESKSSCAIVSRDRYGLGAAAIYLALALPYFGRDLSTGLSAVRFGHGPDPSQMIWLLAWWPHALGHRENPFISPNVWAPIGLNLTWAVGMPLASIVLAPLTAWLGPIDSYNVLCLICPVLAGWSAYLLVRHLKSRWHAGLFAGYIFGFSPYMLGALIGGHPYLSLTFPIPLIVLASLRAYEGTIKLVTLTWIAALLIVAEFLFSTEVAATIEVFGGTALLLGWYLADGNERAQISALFIPLLWANAIAAVLLAPYLYYMLAFGVPHGAINSPAAYATDLLNFFLPTPTVQIGGLAPLKAIAGRFSGNIGEAGGYIAPPLLLILVLYWRAHRREPATRLLFLLLAIIAVAELGPRLHVAGFVTIGMPWKLATHVPLLQNALPARFSMYASIVVAIIVASWLTFDAPPVWLQWLLIALTIVLSLPNLATGAFTASDDTPSFFTSTIYRTYLAPGEAVLVLPFGVTGNSMQWLAQTDMYFRMAGGNSAIMPRDYEAWPIVNAFLSKTLIPDPADQLKAFCVTHGVTVIAAEAARSGLWMPLLAALDPAPQTAAGMIVYRVPDLSAYRGITALKMERRADEARFEALLKAARAYLAGGGDAANLSPGELQKHGWLPADWVADPDVRTKNGLFLGPLDDGTIGVGVVGSYEALQPLIEHYRPLAATVYFPYPKKLAGPPRGDTFMRLLVISFKPVSLLQPPAR